MGKSLRYFNERANNVKPINLPRVEGEFAKWWNSRSSDYQRAALLEDFQVPAKRSYTMDGLVDIELLEPSQEKLIAVISSSVQMSLRQFVQDKNQGKLLRHAIKDLLNHNEWLRRHPRWATNPKRADDYHLLASEVLVYQLLHNPTPEVINQFNEYTQFVSGKGHPSYEALGLLFGLIGLAALAGGIVLMPQLAFTVASQNTPAAISLLSISAVCSISTIIALNKGIPRDVSWRMAWIRRHVDVDQSLWSTEKQPERMSPFV